MYVSMYACMHVCLCLCLCLCIWTCLSICICICTCMCICPLCRDMAALIGSYLPVFRIQPVKSSVSWKLNSLGHLGHDLNRKALSFRLKIAQGYVYTTIMELGPNSPSLLWRWGQDCIILVCMDPLGLTYNNRCLHHFSAARGVPYRVGIRSKTC